MVWAETWSTIIFLRVNEKLVFIVAEFARGIPTTLLALEANWEMSMLFTYSRKANCCPRTMHGVITIVIAKT
jgi:hypothetical protein